MPEQNIRKKESNESGRRTFLKKLAVGVSAGLAIHPILGKVLYSQVHKSNSGNDMLPKFPSAKETDSTTVIMMNDLQRALAKPIEQRKWTMLIDIEKCVGCNACVVACIAENNLPPGVSYRKVFDAEQGNYPDVKRFFMPTNCMQCENAPCIDAANKVIPGAMSRRPDGIVVINYDKFKGKEVFKAASDACPYHALYYDDGSYYTQGTPQLEKYEERPVLEYDKQITRAEAKGVTRKCHFCAHRLDAGLLPACVTTCIGQAMYFGDANDSDSLVSQKMKAQNTHTVYADEGTHPRVIYAYGMRPASEVEQTCTSCHE